MNGRRGWGQRLLVVLLLIGAGAAGGKGPSDSPVGSSPLHAAIRGSAPTGVVIRKLDGQASGYIVRGDAAAFDDVSEFMRSLAHVVRFDESFGVIVERSSSRSAARVQFFDQRRSVLEFPLKDLHPIRGELETTRTDPTNPKRILFSIIVGPGA